ncbi:MAG: hypothetical protein WCK08_19360, partial [Betaproteobacteria bacterium]
MLDFDGGLGNDSFVILGGAAGSVTRGGSGKDEFVSGSRGGLRFEGGDGNDVFIGGSGADIIDMGAGENTISGGQGNDQIRLSGSFDTVDAGDGDDLITLSLAGAAKIDGGAGNDRVVLDTFSSAGPLQFNHHQLVVNSAGSKQRAVDFNDTVELIVLNDLATQTVIQSGYDAANAPASWGQTDLTLDAAGLLDVGTYSAKLVAQQATFNISAGGIRGTVNTDLAELTLVNRGTAGAAADQSIVLREADDLRIVSSGRLNGGLYAAQGSIDLGLVAREAELTLASGVIATGAGGNLSIRADDIDFASGNNQVYGSGTLTVRAMYDAQNYRIGGAGQSNFGYDYSAGVDSGYMELGSRDMSALANGFSQITIGHRTAGGIMRIGDLEDGPLGNDFVFSARLDDVTTFLADRMEIVGDVQSTQLLTLNARALVVERQNQRSPLGAPDSGLKGPQLFINVDEQMLVSGWVIADQLIDIRVTNSTGVGGFVGYGSEVNSFTADKGSTIQTLAANSRVLLTTSHSVYSATGIYAGVEGGTGASVQIDAGTGLSLLEGGTVATRYDRGSIVLKGGSYIHLLSGSAVVSGARFNTELLLLGPFTSGEVVTATVNGTAVSYTVQAGDIQAQSTDTVARVATGLAAAINAQAALSAALTASASGARIAFAARVAGTAYTVVPTGDKLNAVDVPVLTGTESTLTLSTQGEMTLAGSLTAAGKMTLQASEVKDEFADYFNSLSGAQLTQTGSQADAASIVAGLQANQSFKDNSKLAALFTGGTLTIDADNAVLVSLANYVPFAELPEATRNAIASAQGYQTMATGGYFNPTSGRFFTTIQDGPVVGYDIDAINWGSTAKPAKGTAFAALSAAQQQVIASALGYSMHSGTVFYNRLAQGQEVVTGFAQGVSADYDNSRIDWAAAGLAAPAANATFAQLSAAQKLVVANSLGYLFDYERIAYEDWSSVPFDYSTVSRAEWTEASSLNFALVISDKQWGTVAKPATGTPYSALTAAQQAVVDQYVKFVPTQTDLFTLSGSFTAGQTLSLVLNGSTLNYTVQASDIGADAAAT